MKNQYKPAYRVIMDDIRKDIADGLYSVDDMIPSQAQLAKKYDVSRITARDAINELVHHGILYTKQGTGTFVSKESKFSYPGTRFKGFSTGIEGSEKKLATKVLKLEYCKASLKETNKLGIPENLEIVALDRLRIIENIPVVVTRTSLNRQLFMNIDFLKEDFSKVSLYDTLQTLSDIKILYVDEEIRAIKCPIDVAEKLAIEPNEPILYIRRFSFNSNEECFEWGEQYERTDVAGMNIRSYNTTL